MRANEELSSKTSNPRIRIALDITEKLKSAELYNNELLGMLLGGSVSRGIDDRHSDVEILMFLKDIPSLEDRQMLVSLLNFNEVKTFDFDRNEDNLLVNGIQVNLSYYTERFDVEMISDVTEYFLPDYRIMGLIDTIRNGKILYGEDFLNGVKEKCSEYSDALGENLIIDNLKHLHYANMDIFIERNNPTEYFTGLIMLQKKVFNILSAVNRKYIGGYKWMYHELDAMEKTPEGISDIFRNMFKMEPHEAIAEMKLIIQNTLILADEAYPNLDLDIDKIMSRYSLKRDPDNR